MHIIQLGEQQTMNKNRAGKCSFVLERQHTNLHLFYDLFEIVLVCVSSHVKLTLTAFKCFFISFILPTLSCH